LKKLLLFTVALVIMLFSQVQAANVDTVKAAIVKHSIEMGVDPAITLSIAKTESGYRHETKSSYGAVGVFQLMPSTARRMGLNPYSLDDNIKGGIMYYKSMYKMFGSIQLAIAAYNAGPAIVKKYNAVPPFAETKRFVSRIMSDYHYLKAHTDPAVTAYMKTKKEQEQKKLAQQQKHKENVSAKATVAEKTVTDTKATKTPVPAVLANAKAPVPSSKSEKTNLDVSDLKKSENAEM